MPNVSAKSRQSYQAGLAWQLIKSSKNKQNLKMPIHPNRTNKSTKKPISKSQIESTNSTNTPKISTQKKLAKNRHSSPLARLTSKSSQAKMQSESSSEVKSSTDSFYSLGLIASHLFLARRLKAFITDIFMLYTPILYIATYVVLGSAEEFRQNQLVIFICFAIYACIYSLFIAISGQTPGLKYANLKLIYIPKSTSKSIAKSNLDNPNDFIKDSQKVGFFRAFVRIVLWAFGVAFVFGIFTPLFLRKKEFFYDALTSVHIIDSAKIQNKSLAT